MLTKKHGEGLFIFLMVIIVAYTFATIKVTGGGRPGKPEITGGVPIKTEEPVSPPEETPEPEDVPEDIQPITMFVVGDHVIERSKPNTRSVPKTSHASGEAVVLVAKTKFWYQTENGGWIRQDMLKAAG